MKDAVNKRIATTPSAGYIELLRGNRNFRMLWLGQVVSQMGDWFDTIALYTIILNLTGSGRAVGLLLVARFLPSFFFGSLSGVVADRFSRRSIMIVSDVLRAVVVLGFVLGSAAAITFVIWLTSDSPTSGGGSSSGSPRGGISAVAGGISFLELGAVAGAGLAVCFLIAAGVAWLVANRDRS